MTSIELGIHYHKKGDLAKAKEIYTGILVVDPKNCDATHLLGLVYFAQKDYDSAIKYIKQATINAPDGHIYWNSLGEVYRNKNIYKEAIKCYKKAIKIGKNYWEAYSNIGIAYLSVSEYEKAIQSLQKALTHVPENLSVLVNLGRAYLENKNLKKAKEILQNTVKQKPHSWEAWVNLSSVFRIMNQLVEAEKTATKAIEICNCDPSVYINLGTIYVGQGRWEKAFEVFSKALSLDSVNLDALGNLGSLMRDLKEYKKSEKYFKKAIELDKNHAHSLYGLSECYRKQYKLSKARSVALRCIDVDSEKNDYWRLLGLIEQDAGNLKLARDYLLKAIKYDYDSEKGDQGLLFNYNYSDDVEPETVRVEHEKWASVLGEIAKQNLGDISSKRSKELHRRIKVGLVSADWKYHPVSQFTKPILEFLSREYFELFCFSCNKHPNVRTNEFSLLPEHWIDVAFLSDCEFHSMITRLEIDILIDLMGYSSSPKLRVFSMQPAPLQISYLGYPNTTGLSQIQYRLSDEFADPIGMTDHHFSETIYRMQSSAWCYTQVVSMPLSFGSSFGSKRHITFGSFNNFSKITDSVKELWKKILNRIDSSHLLLKARAFKDDNCKLKMYQDFKKSGIDGDRIKLLDWTDSYEENLNSYRLIDIALDTFPYNGVTTTCDAMYMGIPVITLAGRTHASRVGVSLLTNVGLEEFIAETEEEYVEKAVALAQQPERLIELRRTLRQRMEQSPLMDGPGFAKRFGDALEDMWRMYLENQSADGSGAGELK